MKPGAYDYLLKPFDFTVIKMLLQKIVVPRNVIKESIVPSDEKRKPYRF